MNAKSTLLLIGLSSLVLSSACKKDENKTEETTKPSGALAKAKTEATPGKQGGKATLPVKENPACPDATVLTAVKHTPAGSDALPLPEAKTFVHAKARLESANKLNIYIGTNDWPLESLGKQNPVREESQALLNITLRSDKLAAGESYAETGGLESPLGITLFSKGLSSGVHPAKPSAVKLLGYSDTQVCGEFSIQGMFFGDNTNMVGSFIAPISK